VISLALLAVILVLVGLVIPRLLQANARNARLYTKSESLFTPAERSFLGVLDQAVGDRYRVFGKVRVADVVSVRSGNDKADWRKAYNRINQKHFDFVLCTPGDLAIACAIELDDRSHQRRDRRERDDFLNTLCQAISLPLVRIPTAATYAVPEVRRRIHAAMPGSPVTAVPQAPSRPKLVAVEANPAAPKQPASARFSAAVKPASKPVPAQTLRTVAAVNPPKPACPRCSAPMVRRTARRGPHVGRDFWSCTTYPDCRGLIAIQGGATG